MRIQAPARCPRCRATTIDATLDPSRRSAMAEWVIYKAPNALLLVMALVMVVATIGAWLVVMGIWSFAMLPKRMAQKAAAQAAAKDCVRSHCRSCGLDWYTAETASIEAANKR
jgi:hypothetical protein